jgi:2-oxoglutarate dehydrogenase complex dehydrogenase (E1) component-like enzyme
MPYSHPLPFHRILASYPQADKYVWVQEEARNSGAYHFVAPRLQRMIGATLRYIGRPPMASPAVGLKDQHEVQLKAIVSDLRELLQQDAT